MIHERSTDTNAGSSGPSYRSHLIGEGNWLTERAQGCSSQIDRDKLAWPALAASRPPPVPAAKQRILHNDNRGRITTPDALAQSLQKLATTSIVEILRRLGPQLERVRFVTQYLRALSDHAHCVSSTYRQSPSPAVRVSSSKSGGTSPVNTALPRASSRINRIFPCSAFLSEDISSR